MSCCEVTISEYEARDQFWAFVTLIPSEPRTSYLTLISDHMNILNVTHAPELTSMGPFCGFYREQSFDLHHM